MTRNDFISCRLLLRSLLMHFEQRPPLFEIALCHTVTHPTGAIAFFNHFEGFFFKENRIAFCFVIYIFVTSNRYFNWLRWRVLWLAEWFPSMVHRVEAVNRDRVAPALKVTKLLIEISRELQINATGSVPPVPPPPPSPWWDYRRQALAFDFFFFTSLHNLVVK